MQTVASCKPKLKRAVLMNDLNPENWVKAVSYTHLRAHETREYLVCRLLLEKGLGILFILIAALTLGQLLLV